MATRYFSGGANRGGTNERDADVSLSIITATYQRPVDTAELVRSIRRSVMEFTESTDSNVESVTLECLVCCKGSDTPTIESLRSVDWQPLEIITTSSHSASRNRNVAIERATGEYIVSVDSDCVVAPDWIESICEAVIEHDYPGAVQGAYHHDYPAERNWFTKQECEDDQTRFLEGQADSRNISFRQDVYRAIDGYGTHYQYAEAGEDLTLRPRIEEAGFEFVIDPAIVVTHKYPTSLVNNLRRFNRYGRGAIYVKRRCPEVYSDGYSLPKKWGSTIIETARLLIPGRESSGISECSYKLLKRCAYTIGYVQGRVLYNRE